MSSGVLEAADATELVGHLQRLAARLDPDAISDGEVKGMLVDLGQAKRLVDGMLTLMARRTFDVAESTGKQASREARDQVAEATGSTGAQAKKRLDTSVRLRDNDDVADAVRSGALSDTQAEAVAKVIIRVDAAALKRGFAEADETCDIAGIGRVPVEAVKELIPDAHIAYVIRDALDTTVVHLGRQVTALQRTALQARGYECEVPACRSTHLLEIDHLTEWAISRQTRLDQLAWLCRAHHRQKSRGTHHLTGPPDGRQWEPTQTDRRHSRSHPDRRQSTAVRSHPAAGPAEQRSHRFALRRSGGHDRTEDLLAWLALQDGGGLAIGRWNNQPIHCVGNFREARTPVETRARADRLAVRGWAATT